MGEPTCRPIHRQVSRLPNRTSFKKGVSGNPAGKPKGAKDRFGHTRSAKHAVIELLDHLGNDTALLEATLVRGLQARAPGPPLRYSLDSVMRIDPTVGEGWRN